MGIFGEGLEDDLLWRISLSHDAVDIDGTTESWCHADGAPEQERCFLAFRPSAPLDPDTDYSLLFEADDGWGGDDDHEPVFISTGSTEAVQVEGQPSVQVTATRTEASTCGWPEARVWDLSLTPASSDFHGLSLLHVYSVDTDDSTTHVATREVPAGGSLVTATVARSGSDPATDCFVVIQEDTTGGRSPASDIACWASDPDTGSAPPADELDAGGCGCSATPAGAAHAPWALAVLAGWRRREEC